MTRKILIVLLPLLLFANGCSDSGAEPESVDKDQTMETMPVSFIADIQPVLQSSCGSVGCHGLATASGYSVADYESITGSADHGPVVVAGFADSSNLYLKLLDPPPFGGRMPANGPPYLSESTISLIHSWISQGAEDN